MVRRPASERGRHPLHERFLMTESARSRSRSCSPARAASAPASIAPSRSSSAPSSATAGRSMSATRSCTTASSSRASRPRARSSSTSSTRCPTTGPWSSPRMACRRRCRPRRRAATCSIVDATCPLVSKVHREAERHHESGRTVILIGHAGHPEVIGTMGQLPAGAVLLVEDVAQAETLDVPDPPQPRLCHADDAVGRRHDRDRGRAAPPLPGDPGPEDGGHLLRHHQPAGRGQGDRRATAMRWW